MNASGYPTIDAFPARLNGASAGKSAGKNIQREYDQETDQQTHRDLRTGLEEIAAHNHLRCRMFNEDTMRSQTEPPHESLS